MFDYSADWLELQIFHRYDAASVLESPNGNLYYIGAPELTKLYTDYGTITVEAATAAAGSTAGITTDRNIKSSSPLETSQNYQYPIGDFHQVRKASRQKSKYKNAYAHFVTCLFKIFLKLSISEQQYLQYYYTLLKSIFRNVKKKKNLEAVTNILCHARFNRVALAKVEHEWHHYKKDLKDCSISVEYLLGFFENPKGYYFGQRFRNRNPI